MLPIVFESKKNTNSCVIGVFSSLLNIFKRGIELCGTYSELPDDDGSVEALELLPPLLLSRTLAPKSEL